DARTRGAHQRGAAAFRARGRARSRRRERETKPRAGAGGPKMIRCADQTQWTQRTPSKTSLAFVSFVSFVSNAFTLPAAPPSDRCSPLGRPAARLRRER